MSPSVAPRAAELPPELPFAPELPPRPGSKHPCIQNRQSYGNVTGTLEQMDAMEHCINNGCFSYPLPISKMYIPYKALADDPRMIKHVKKSESVKNEYVHKGSNRLVHDISHMGEVTSWTSASIGSSCSTTRRRMGSWRGATRCLWA